MIITSKLTGLCIIPASAHAPQLNIQPGANEVPGEVWEKLRNHKVIKAHLEAQPPRLIADEKESLKDISTERAVAIVKDTFNKDLLAKWREQDIPDVVRAAIVAQGAALERASKARASGAKGK